MMSLGSNHFPRITSLTASAPVLAAQTRPGVSARKSTESANMAVSAATSLPASAATNRRSHGPAAAADGPVDDISRSVMTSASCSSLTGSLPQAAGLGHPCCAQIFPSRGLRGCDRGACWAGAAARRRCDGAQGRGPGGRRHPSGQPRDRRTVESHVSSLLRKLAVPDRAALAALAKRVPAEAAVARSPTSLVGRDGSGTCWPDGPSGPASGSPMCRSGSPSARLTPPGTDTGMKSRTPG